MSTNFFITKISVKLTGSGNDYYPIVFKTHNGTQISYGVFCTNTVEVDPIKIHQAGSTPPSGNSYLMISTSRGQYQIYWNDGASNNFTILLQSLTTPNPYPNNQYNLWTGSNANQNFTLNIDMTALGQGNGITLTPGN